jgi:hypothetical protein
MQRRTSPPRETRTRPIVTRFLARRLWSSATPPTLAASVAFQRRAYEKSVVLVRAYYAVSVFFVTGALSFWPRYAGLGRATPLWPAGWWFDWVSVRTGVNMIFGAYLVATLVVLLVPEQRLARAAYSFALLQYMAFVNGFDKIGADLHMWFFVSAILILLPRGPWTARRVADRQYFITVIWTCQFIVLFFYTLTGFWKVYTALDALAAGKINGFSLSGFSYIIGYAMLRTKYDTVLGDFLTRNVLAGWAMYCGTMFLEGFSVIAAFRPRLQRFWGLGLILFHIGTQLAMGFTFPKNVVLLALFLVASPFAPDRIVVKDTLLDLPVVHFVSRRLTALRRRGARAPGSEELGPSGAN